jgi:hypothetical protein
MDGFNLLKDSEGFPPFAFVLGFLSNISIIHGLSLTVFRDGLYQLGTEAEN